MICFKCGKEIQDGSKYCIYCSAAQENTNVKKKKIIMIAVIAVIVVIIAAVIIGFVSSSSSSGLSGRWEYYRDDKLNSCDWAIELNHDGTCVIYEFGRVPYSATYTKNDNGTYVTSNFLPGWSAYGAWIIKKDGNNLIISGPELRDNTIFTKVSRKTPFQDVDEANMSNNNTQFEFKKVGSGVKITGYVGDYSYEDGDGDIVIPETINGLSVKEIGDYAFEGCQNLRYISLPDGLTKIGDRAFNFCTLLESVSIPESVTEIGSCAFGSCISLTSINIPSAVKKISPSTFSYCGNLRQLTLPDGLMEIGNYAFSECGITELIIPDTVTKIGEGAFLQSGLTSITIPSGVREIEKYTFRQSDIPYMISFPRTEGKFPHSSPDLPPMEVNFTGTLSWLCRDAFDKNSTVNYRGKSYSLDNLYFAVNGEPNCQPFSSTK